MSIVEFIKENPRTLYGIIEYVKDNKKTESSLCFGYGVNPRYAYQEMQFVKIAYQQEDRRQYKQIIVSFEDSDRERLNNENLFFICKKIAAYYSANFQVLAVVHLNKHNIHVHFIINSVDAYTGRKFISSPIDLYTFKKHVNTVLQEYGLSSVRMYAFPETT